MQHKTIWLKGYCDGLANKPNASHRYIKFGPMWRAYEAGYKQGMMKRNAA